MKGALSFLIAIFLIPLVAEQAGAVTWDVPHDRDTIALAIQTASSGDSVLVTEDHTEPAGFTVDKQLTITKNPGLTVTVTAGSSDTFAVVINADPQGGNERRWHRRRRLRCGDTGLHAPGRRERLHAGRGDPL